MWSTQAFPCPKLIDRFDRIGYGVGHECEEEFAVFEVDDFSSAAFFSRAPAVDRRSGNALKRFTEVVAAVNRHQAADPVDTEKAIFEGAIPKHAPPVGSPLGIFSTPQQFQQLKEMENSERKGFGHRRIGAAGACHRAAGDGRKPIREGGAAAGR